MKNIYVISFMLCSLIWMAVACTNNTTDPAGTSAPGSTSPTPTPTAPTFTFIYTTYISGTCNSCHGSAGQNGVQINASSQSNFYNSIVNQLASDGCATTLVSPNNASQSAVYLRLSTTCGSPAAQMPLGGPYLNSTQLAQVAAWINAGALNN